MVSNHLVISRAKVPAVPSQPWPQADIVHMAGFVFDAAGHLEIAREFGLVALEAETRRLAAEQLDVVGHVVVVGKVADGHVVEPRVALGLPMARAQLFADRFERGAVDFAAPVLFECELQFPVGAHARKAEGVGTGGHLQVFRSLDLENPQWSGFEAYDSNETFCPFT